MHTNDDDLRAADAAAVRASAALVARVTDDDLDRRTPCAAWDLKALVQHMTAQHRGFAAAAEGRGMDPAVWQTTPTAPVVADHADAAEGVIKAFAAADMLDRPFAMPEFGAFPGRMVIGFHLVDYLVHGWDVARALDLPYQPSPEVIALARPIARAVPDGPDRLAAGAPFAPALAVASGADELDEILSLLGRDPRWRA